MWSCLLVVALQSLSFSWFIIRFVVKEQQEKKDKEEEEEVLPEEVLPEEDVRGLLDNEAKEWGVPEDLSTKVRNN